LCTAIIIIVLATNYRALNKLRLYAIDSELDALLSSLPSNLSVCMEMQKLIGKECKIEIDNKTKSSAYIFFLNKIILSDKEHSKNSFSRIILIAHECIHSIQNHITHILNFLFCNVMILYDLYTLALILQGICPEIHIAIVILFTFMHLYYRIILETDAVYRSMILADKYLVGKGLEHVIEKYNEIMPGVINAMYFTYLFPQLLKIEIFIVLIMIF
jgi:Zn-dependent membrane protease YugP